MLPTPASRPDYHAMRCIVLGAVIAGIWWCPSGQVWALLFGTLETGGRGESLWREMLPRCGRTVLLVTAAATFAASLGTLLAFASASLGLWLGRVVTWCGQWLAAVPAVGLAWCAMAWLVNDLQLPVESLIPYSPPVERDSWSLALGRWIWTWVVPFWVLALPLTGLWMSDLAERLRMAWPVPAAEALTARGVGPLRLRWHHWLRSAWIPLVDRWLRLCLIGLGFSIGVESVFGLPGWGTFASRAAAAPGTMAVTLYSGAWMMAALCGLAGLIQWLRRTGSTGEESAVGKSLVDCQMPSTGRIIGAWVSILLLGVMVAQPAPAEWMNMLAGPWLLGLLPGGWAATISQYQSALLGDVALACRFALQAGLLSLVVGTLSWCIRRALRRPLPRFEWLAGLAWSPLLLMVFCLPADSQAWSAAVLVVVVADGASVWRGHCLALEDSGYVQASKGMGMLAGRSLWHHAWPLLLTAQAGWMLRVAGTVMVWKVAATSVAAEVSTAQTAAAAPNTLGAFISAASTTILTDAGRMIWPDVLAALITWGFWRLASVVGAVSPSPAKDACFESCNFPPAP